MEGNARRRLSATPNTSDTAKPPQGELEAEPNKETALKGSKLLERASTHAVIAVALLAFLVLWSFSSVLTGQPPSDIFPFLRQPARHTGDETIGILLHPEDHSARDVQVTELYWTVTAGFRAPDGVRKRVYLVNGLFPGPTIEARSGDTLRVHVHNSLDGDEGVSVHWHGLTMNGFNNMDGAVGFAQCAIPPGGNFTYEFRIDVRQHGTFWYHAHSREQRGDGLYGGLVVHRPDEDGVEDGARFGYEMEALLLIGDWFHRSAEEMLAWYTSTRAFGNEPVPDSLVVNGIGRFDCSMAVPARPVMCNQITEEAFPGIIGSTLVRTRLRIVNVGSIAGFTVKISQASMTPIQVDGGCEIARSPAESVGILYPGERVDVLVHWNEKANAPRLEMYLDPENFNYPNPSLIANQTFPILPAKSRPSESTPISELSEAPHFNLQTAFSAKKDSIPANIDQIILLYTRTEKLTRLDNRPTGFINRTSWAPQAIPLLALPRQQWNEHQLVPWVPLPSHESSHGEKWVDVIINNLDDGSHPFHLHGHSFYVVASHRSVHGWGSYDPYSSAPSAIVPQFNTVDPLRKDTVMVPRRGFAVLRLRFGEEGSGVWMLHCHVLVHQGSGMSMAIQVGGDKDHEAVDEGAKGLCKL